MRPCKSSDLFKSGNEAKKKLSGESNSCDPDKQYYCTERCKNRKTFTVSDDVNGLVVQVKEAVDAAPGRQEGPVPGVDVGVELKMPRHVPPPQQGGGLLSVRLPGLGGGRRDVGVVPVLRTAAHRLGGGLGHRYFGSGGFRSSDDDDDDDMLSVSPRHRE